MALRGKHWVAAGSLALVIGGSWLTYGLMAAQGQGALAQAPLNIEVQAPPAFLMALDDSGSMIWETLNNTRDGVYRWVDNVGFYQNNGVPYGYADRGLHYYFLTPAYGRSSAPSIPPLDDYGFARSPDINRAYFDPRDSYPTWKTGARDTRAADYRVIDPKNAPLDPRPTDTGLADTVSGTQDLTRVHMLRSDSWRFTFGRGMRIPAGSIIESGRCTTEPAINAGNSTAVDSAFRKLNGNVRVIGQCTANMAYFPATFYLLDPASLPADYGYVAQPEKIDGRPHGYPGTLYKFEIKPANFGDSTTQYNAAMQNFANWFSFYRTRREALIGAVSNALQDSTNLRVGWFRINDRNTASMYNMSEEREKMALLKDIAGKMRANGNTPNRRAARHLGEQFSTRSSATEANPPVLLACQKNAGMLFTDGYINESGSGAVTHSSISQLIEPFYSKSLAPRLETYSVPVPAECKGPSPDPALDCRTNLHMNFYGVTLGTLGAQYGVSYVPDEEKPWLVSPDPYRNPPSTAPVKNLDPAAVDEIWQATLATHGEMINATKPANITAAMRRIISSVSQGRTPSGTRSLTGARIGVGSLSVEPFYEATNSGTDWYSELTAYTLGVDPETRKIVSTEAWKASEKMPTPSARNIWMWRAGGLRHFDADSVRLADLCDKPTGLYSGMAYCSESEIRGLATDAATAVAYLRGETRGESRNGGTLRDRSTVLGDIINSSPVLSAPTDDHGYQALRGLGASYASYLRTKRAQRRYMVYAGANDGMLHAFDGGMGADGRMDDAGGREQFAFIPSTALGHMGNLLLPYDPKNQNIQRFEHRYYVDGPVTVSDVNQGAGWSTALVGTAGAGGRSVFALDVSDPARFGASSLLWEISDLDTRLAPAVLENIGHVLGKPVVVPVKEDDGSVRFKAIFGNGFESRGGRAVLFVVDMAPTRPGVVPDIRMIVAQENGDALPAGRNGLGSVVVVDRWGGDAQQTRVRDGLADTVYAADQKGAVWKFDLRKGLPPARPLFVTDSAVDPASGRTYRQPITGGMTATAGSAGGVMLLFGTGSFSYVGDGQDRSVQGIYGVNDTGDGQPVTTLTSASLRRYTVRRVDDRRQLTLGALPDTERGWTIVLPARERVVGTPRVTSGVVFIPTYTPLDGDQSCSTEGANWLFGLSSTSGAGALSQVRFGSPDGASPGDGTAGVPLDTGGSAPVRDVTTSVVPRLAPPADATKPPPDLPDAPCVMQIGVAGAEPMYLPYPCGRQSWRQIQ